MNYPGAKYRASLSQLIESNTYLTHIDLTNFLKKGLSNLYKKI